VPPVVGSVLIGMEQGQLQITSTIRARLAESVKEVKNGGSNDARVETAHA